MITVDSDIGSSIEQAHYALVPSHEFSFAPELRKSAELFRDDWEQLETDPYMADGGSYRLRRYGLYDLSGATGQLTHISDASFYQSSSTNPLHGGTHRRFAAMAAKTIDNTFLHELILFDLEQLTSNKFVTDDWLIGVHQIRILATTGVPGSPTPEGIHRDDETYTSQHLITRHNIAGGINYFYGHGPEPTGHPKTVWKQQSYFDSYYFDRSLWHSVSPILADKCDSRGHRDVLLIDFVKSDMVVSDHI